MGKRKGEYGMKKKKFTVDKMTFVAFTIIPFNTLYIFSILFQYHVVFIIV